MTQAAQDMKQKEKYDPSDDELRSIINLYEDKVPLKSIGAKFGVNYSTIAHRLIALKVPARRYRETRLTETQIDECISGYRSRKDIIHKPRVSRTAKFVKGVKVAPVKPLQGRFRRHTVHIDEEKPCDHSGCMNKTRGRFCVEHSIKGHRAAKTHLSVGRFGLDAKTARYG